MRKLAAVCVVLATLLVGPSAGAGYGHWRLLFVLKDPNITESSGVASYSKASDILFTHNDSGDIPRFFAIGPQGQTLATYTVLGAAAADWEDMARGPGDDRKPALFFGDIGDNFTARPFVTIYEVPEPKVDRSIPGASLQARPASITKLVYEDGPRDAETLFVDQRTGRIGIVSKTATGESGVYLAEGISEVHASPGAVTKTAILHRAGTIRFTKIARPYRKGDFDAASRLQATGGDISRDDRRLVVRTYVEAFEWNISKGIARGLRSRPMRIPLPRTAQGEAIAYTRDGRSLVTTTEQVPAPVHLIPG